MFDLNKHNIYIDKVLNRYLDTDFIREIKNLANRIPSNAVNDEQIRENFRVHLENLVSKCAIVRTLVDPKERINLEDIYVPLTLMTSNGKIKVEDFKSRLFGSRGRNIIKDTAGTGKTTLSEFIALKIIEEQKGIPFLFELRKLDGSVDLLNELLTCLNTPNQLFDKSTYGQLARKNFFFILLDGYDEIPQRYRTAVKRDIVNLQSHLYQWNYIITSRHDLLDAGFNLFDRSSVKPMEIEEAIEQIIKYEDVYHHQVAEGLILEIHAKFGEANLRSILENPFIVSLLYKIYSRNEPIPQTKDKLFFEVYKALLNDQNELKELERVKKCGLRDNDFTQVIEKFAYDTLEQTQTEYHKNDALRFIHGAIPEHLKSTTDSDYFLYDLLVTVPLLIEEKLKYRWWQKSFQDYFAAEYLKLRSNKLTILEAIYNTEKAQYLNLLDIFYDLDYVSFSKSVTKLLVKDFLLKFESIKEIPNIDPVLQTIRRQLLAFHDLIYIYNKNEMKYEAVIKYIEQMEGKNIQDPVVTEVTNEISVVYQSNFKLDLIRQIGRRGKEVFLNENKIKIDGHLKISPLTTTEPKQARYIYKIESKSTEWFNQPESFKIINDFLSLRQVTPYVFDPITCKEISG